MKGRYLFSASLSYNCLQYPPAVFEGVQFADAVYTLVLEAGNLDGLEAGLVHTNVHEGFHFKTVGVNFHMIEAIFPESVIAVA